jgi:hypothetical protein
MRTFTTRHGLGAIALAVVTSFVAACSGSPLSSLSPTSPTAAVGGSASFSPNPGVPVCELPNVLDPNTGACEPPPVCELPNVLDPITKECKPPTMGNQGCTPGYWKANVKKGAGEWILAGYMPSQSVSSVFSGATGSLGSATLLQALEFGGGSTLTGAKQILLRAAVAAILNAANDGVDYPISAAMIIADVNAALASTDREAILRLAGSLDSANNLGCPLNNSSN